MLSFFCGWKRKVGVVALAMACAFMGLWLRRSLNQDFVQLEVGYWNLTFASNQNGLWLVTSKLPDALYQPGIHWHKHEKFAIPGRGIPFSNDPFGHLGHWGWATEQRWDLYGFHFGRYHDDRPIGGVLLQFTIIPHESIVIPLTFLSAWLLLSKQPAAKKQSPDPS